MDAKDRPSPTQMKIVNHICWCIFNYQAFIIRGAKKRILIHTVRQLQLQMPVYIPSVNAIPNNLHRSIKSKSFPAISKIQPIEKNFDRFITSLELAVGEKHSGFMSTLSLEQMNKISTQLSTDLDSLGEFTIILKDFDQVHSHDIQYVVSLLIQKTKNVHWLIISDKLFDLPNKVRLMKKAQMYGINLNTSLTDKEFELMVELANGMSMKEAREFFDVKQSTLKNRKVEMKQKLNIKTDFMIAQVAAENGLTFLENPLKNFMITVDQSQKTVQ